MEPLDLDTKMGLDRCGTRQHSLKSNAVELEDCQNLDT